MLLCTVRDCHKPLNREEKRMVCAARHSFDIARSGYINLLQPQDRRSKNPGDTAEAVAARRRLHDRGVAAGLRDGLRGFAGISPQDSILDAGCGDGFYLGTLGRGCGIDISAGAIDLAARRYPRCEWVVANADRFIPYSDEVFSLAMSITGRMNPPEFRRVLRTDGRLLIAVAAPDDLLELRGEGKDRVERTIHDFAAEFRLVNRDRVTTAAELDAPAVQDVLTAIYRPLRSQPIEAMRVTFSLDLMLMERR
ncbi:MAG: methyltransferase domain-containing protein [Acidobacteriota bacterium]|nr:methyltransferase domain-containing protein [Acidobacteriota bacterium]